MFATALQSLPTWTSSASDRQQERQRTQKIIPQNAVLPYPAVVYDVSDPEWSRHLDREGWVAIGNVMDSEQVDYARNLAWDFLEGIGTGIDRSNPETWGNESWPGMPENGVINAYRVGQCELLWYIRQQPAILEAFARVWNDRKLLVSFDGFCAYRPIEYDLSWKTEPRSWPHVDQNYLTEPGLACVQGIVTLTDSGPNDGGLVVCPRSHAKFTSYFESHVDNVMDWNGKHATLHDLGHFVRVPMDCELSQNPIKPCVPAGTLVLWDSRTVHWNTPITRRVSHMRPKNQAPVTAMDHNLFRMVAYVCMTPASKASQDVIEKRVDGYLRGVTTSHWPHLFIENANVETIPCKGKRVELSAYVPLELSSTGRKLLGLES